jgi:Na+-driven multidrug efflux pump
LSEYLRIEAVMVAPEEVAVVGVATVGAEMVGVVAAVVVVLYEQLMDFGAVKTANCLKIALFWEVGNISLPSFRGTCCLLLKGKR